MWMASDKLCHISLLKKKVQQILPSLRSQEYDMLMKPHNNQRNIKTSSEETWVLTPYCPAPQFLHMQNGTFNQIIQQAPCALTFYEKLQHLMDLWLGYSWFLSCTFQFSRMSLYYFYNRKKYKTSLKNVLIVTQTGFSQAKMLLFQY